MKSPKSITIAAIQTAVSPEIARNVGKTAAMVGQAAKQGAKIVCLQELFQTPYFPQHQGRPKDDYAETLQGPTVSAMRAAAKQHRICIIAPFYEKKAGKYHNTAAVISEQGKLMGQYNKIHIPQDPGFYEKEYFEQGKAGYKTFTRFGVKFAVLICYDQWFPEAARQARLAGAQIIFYPTAIGDIVGYRAEGDWHDAWETVQRGHAIANSLYVMAVNRTGREGRIKFWGQSFLSDPFGKIILRGDRDKEDVLVARLDLSRNEFFSEGWGFLRNRRPDTYHALTSRKFTKRSKRLAAVPHYQEEKRALGQA